MKKLDLFFILMFSILLIGISTISCAKNSGTVPVNKISFNFEIEGSGVLELSVTNSRGVSLYNYTVENAEEKVEIEESIVQGNTLLAKASASKGYVFNAWDGVSEATGDAVIVPESLVKSTIKVSFISNPYTGSQAAIDPGTEADHDAGDGWIWVYKPEHIKWISDTVNGGNSLNTKKYKFRNDISFNGKDHNPIGNNTSAFKGKIDGNGKSFKEAKIVANGTSVGFIGILDQGGEIKNLTIDSSVEINVSVQFVGGVVGALSGGTIINCVNKAGITNNDNGGYSYTGGIAGIDNHNSSKIESSYNLGNIFVTYQTYRGAGGILGYTSSTSSITKCYNAGNITLNSTIGSSGGIAGSSANISDSYNTGKVSGGEYSGGIVGSPYSGEYASPLVLENVYSTTVPTVYSGNADGIGGILGDLGITGYSITKSYFVKGSSSVPNYGYSATTVISGDGVDRTKTTADLATLHTEFGTTVWKTATIDGITRPVLIGIGEGK